MAKGNPPISKQQYKHVWQNFLWDKTRRPSSPAKIDNTVISNAISTNTSRQRREKDNSRSIPNYVLPSITSMKI